MILFPPFSSSNSELTRKKVCPMVRHQPLKGIAIEKLESPVGK